MECLNNSHNFIYISLCCEESMLKVIFTILGYCTDLHYSNLNVYNVEFTGKLLSKTTSDQLMQISITI